VGGEVYADRFENLANGLRGDMSVGKEEHTNYRRRDLLALLREHGFDPVIVTGANLFWRWLQIPALLTGGRLRGLLERAIYLDGEGFTSAKPFVAARKRAWRPRRRLVSPGSSSSSESSDGSRLRFMSGRSSPSYS